MNVKEQMDYDALKRELADCKAELSRRQADKGERQTCCQCNWSNGELLNMAHEANYKPEWWCHGCLHRLVNAHRDETGKFIKLTDTAKPKAEPVVTEAHSYETCPPKSQFDWAEEERIKAVQRYERAEAQVDSVLECLEAYKKALAMEGGKMVKGKIVWTPRENTVSAGMSPIPKPEPKPLTVGDVPWIMQLQDAVNKLREGK